MVGSLLVVLFRELAFGGRSYRSSLDELRFCKGLSLIFFSSCYIVDPAHDASNDRAGVPVDVSH